MVGSDVVAILLLSSNVSKSISPHCTVSLYSAAISSKIGFKSRHGGHQIAEIFMRQTLLLLSSKKH